jgi:hypothetical protein
MKDVLIVMNACSIRYKVPIPFTTLTWHQCSGTNSCRRICCRRGVSFCKSADGIEIKKSTENGNEGDPGYQTQTHLCDQSSGTRLFPTAVAFTRAFHCKHIAHSTANTHIACCCNIWLDWHSQKVATFGNIYGYQGGLFPSQITHAALFILSQISHVDQISDSSVDSSLSGNVPALPL